MTSDQLNMILKHAQLCAHIAAREAVHQSPTSCTYEERDRLVEELEQSLENSDE